MKPYFTPRDAAGNLLFDVLPDCDRVDVRVLAANTAEDIDVPTGAKICRLDADGVFYFNTQGDAAVPSADVTDGSGSRFVGSGSPFVMISVDGVDDISVIAGAARKITASFWGA